MRSLLRRVTSARWVPVRGTPRASCHGQGYATKVHGPTKGIPFVDFKRIKVASGRGGDGAISFFGSAKIGGPPSGGNGGRGGDVWIRADKNITSLNGLLNRYTARNGASGRGKQLHGGNGADEEIVVPVGTVVREVDEAEYWRRRMEHAGLSLELDPLSTISRAGGSSSLPPGEEAGAKREHEMEEREDEVEREDPRSRPSYVQAYDQLQQASAAIATRELSPATPEQHFDGHDAMEGLHSAIHDIAPDAVAARRIPHPPVHQGELGVEDERTAQEQEEAKAEEDAAEELEEDPRLVMIAKHFKFRANYVPQEDRVRMLLERIPYLTTTPQPTIQRDLLQHGERHLLLRGGVGGFGNPHFASPHIRAPAIAGRGEPGQERLLELELKAIADAGLVGFPNAGKSTLLKAITNAHPKIAPYPFTTLNPYIGTIDYQDSYSITLADIPGLIPGAHQNRGLGHRFLRHIERSAVLVYVLDLSRSPLADYRTLVHELECYQPGLPGSKRSLVIGNKADLPAARAGLKELLGGLQDPGTLCIPVSAREGKNIEVVTRELRRLVTEATAAVDRRGDHGE